MPRIATLLPAGTELRKHHEGHLWVAVATATGFSLTKDGLPYGRYTSLTATAQAVRGNNNAVNGWDFFGVPNPNRRIICRPRRNAPSSSTESQPIAKGKCSKAGCYEPADCHHGFCHRHCSAGGAHSMGSYGSRSYPRTMALHAAVEVECYYRDADSYRRGLPLEPHSDGSLPTYGAEYKIMAPCTEVIAKMTEVVSEIWKRGGRVNRLCGLHVHLDVRQLTAARKAEWKGWMRRTQETWFALMPPSRRNSTYCRRLHDGSDGFDGNHFDFFHYTNYNTGEVRLHGGTLNHFKIEGWMVALMHIQAKANDPTFAFPNTGDATADFWAVFEDCPLVGKEYIQARHACNGVIPDQAFRAIEE